MRWILRIMFLAQTKSVLLSEENVYFLCKKLCTNRLADAGGADLFVVFISLVLTNGTEVKLQRNALSVIEAPTGNEDDDDLEFENLHRTGSARWMASVIAANLLTSIKLIDLLCVVVTWVFSIIKLYARFARHHKSKKDTEACFAYYLL
ncbi:uncharacterized protein LOC127151131 [Cucumis melo]|uniref:Uncharacterized protein LOC103496204 n=1 Tax=Cucumis melo TaxID=3656 RepID=A0ABM3KBB3_CUCME|nr:uncharacterized protein LOC127143852 [Cucumis melo]XP_050942278.1 uncharacterized protein LOC103496204 [Cucumis melo]XP_050946485.1 uncharacterized protein LOC127151131 [Cucumis melo]